MLSSYIWLCLGTVVMLNDYKNPQSMYSEQYGTEQAREAGFSL